jgi:hypothetical protein
MIVVLNRIMGHASLNDFQNLRICRELSQYNNNKLPRKVWGAIGSHSLITSFSSLAVAILNLKTIFEFNLGLGCGGVEISLRRVLRYWVMVFVCN